MAFIGRLVGEAFKPYVKSQVNRRETILSNHTRTQDELQYITNKTSFIRLTSGVNVNDSSELAKNNKLFGAFNFQTEGAGRFKTGYDGYHFSNTYGYVPPPGITSVEVRALEKGSLREAVINVICHNLEQFKTIEKLYLRLKYSVLLEWGHTMYYDNDGSFVTNPEYLLEDISNDFIGAGSNSVDQFDILAKLEKNRAKSCGNYDGFLGFVTNFDWTLRTDGGYDIIIRAYSIGDIIESLKLNSNLPQVTTDNDPLDDPISLNKNQSTLNYIMYKLKKSVDQYDSKSHVVLIDGLNADGKSFNLSTDEIARITGIKNTYKHPGEAWDRAVSQDFADEDEASGRELYFSYLSVFQKKQFPNLGGSGYQYYMSFHLLLKIIENFLLIYDKDTKKPIFQFNYYDRRSSYYFFTPLQTSIDPRICLSFKPDYNASLSTVTKNQLQGYNVKFTVNVDKIEIRQPNQGFGNVNALPNITSAPATELQDMSNKLNASHNVSAQQLIDFGHDPAGKGSFYTDTLITQNALLQTVTDKLLLNVISAEFPNYTQNSVIGSTSNQTIKILLKDPSSNKEAQITVNKLFDVEENTTQAASNPTNVTWLQGLGRYLGKENEWDAKGKLIINGTELGDWEDGMYQNVYPNDAEVCNLLRININLECINDVISSNLNPDTGEISYIDFLNELLSRVQYAMGSINNFKTVYDEESNTYSIIDANLIPGGLKNYSPTKFTLNELTTSKGSFVTNFSLKTEITPELASMATIGAQSQGNQIGYNSVAFSKWNQGLTDRVLKGKINLNSPDTTNSTNDDLLNSYTQNIANYLYLVYKIGLGTVTPEEIETYSSLAPDVLKYCIGYSVQQGDINGPGFIPVNLQLEIDGLSGMRIYEMYGVSEIFLPNSYKDNLEFVTTNINHRIDGKGWFTTINGIGTPKYKQNPTISSPLLPNGFTIASILSPTATPFLGAGVFQVFNSMPWAPIEFNGATTVVVSSIPKTNRTVNGKTQNHYGIDISAPKDTPIIAPCNGTAYHPGSTNKIGFNGVKDFGSYWVIIQADDGKYHLLGHNSKIDPSINANGQRVKAGQVVAYVGNEGSSYGYHLHWEIRIDLNAGGPQSYDSPIAFTNANPAPPNAYPNPPFKPGA
jgi:hypothetical protein